jgi:hypothetical protein
LKRGEFVFPLYRDRRLRHRPALSSAFWLVDALVASGRDEPGAVHALTGVSQSTRPAGRARASGHRRIVGQLRADLQHGRTHQRGDPPVGTLGTTRFERAQIVRAAASRQAAQFAPG